MSFVHSSHLVRQLGGKLTHQSKLYGSDSTNLFDTFTYDAPQIHTMHRVNPALQRVSNCKQHSVIRFLTAKNTNAAEIHRQISSFHGEETMSVQHIRKWICDFSNGREEVHDLAQAG